MSQPFGLMVNYPPKWYGVGIRVNQQLWHQVCGHFVNEISNANLILPNLHQMHLFLVVFLIN